MSAIKKTTETVKKAATNSDLSGQLETLRDEVGTLTQRLADIGKTKGQGAIAAAKATADDAIDTVVDHTDTARLHAMELQDQANDFVRKQPATALGLAVSAGFLIGYLAARRD
jgi:ElaB/YqjD/DUF883 family membrane-anchored ribosome-binding protein